MLGHLRLAPVLVPFPVAFAEQHGDSPVAAVIAGDDHALIFAVEARHIEAEQVDQAFDQIDITPFRIAAALRAFDAVAKG